MHVMSERGHVDVSRDELVGLLTMKITTAAQAWQLPKVLQFNLVPRLGFVSLFSKTCPQERRENSRIKCSD